MKYLLKLLFLFLLIPKVAQATICTRVGNFTRASGTVPYTQQVSYTTGCQPTVVMLMDTFQTTTGFTTGASFALGISTSIASGVGNSEQRTAAFFMASGLGAGSQTGTGYWQQASIVSMNGTTPTEIGYISAWDTASFTITWSTAPGGTGSIFQYYVIGGTTNAKLLTGLTSPTTNSSKGFTGAGFQPDFGLFLGLFLGVDTTGGATNATLGLGTAVSTSSRWSIAEIISNGTTTKPAHSYATTSFCFTQVNKDATGTIGLQADFVSWDADGFTLNYTTTNGAAEVFAALLLKGDSSVLGSLAKNTGTAPQTDTVSTGSVVGVGALLATDQFAASTSVQTDMNMTLGFSDGTHSRSSYAYMQSAQASTVTERNLDDTNPMSMNVNATQNALCTSFGFSTTNFSCTWNPNSATASQMLWWAIGDIPGSVVRHRATVIQR